MRKARILRDKLAQDHPFALEVLEDNEIVEIDQDYGKYVVIKTLPNASGGRGTTVLPAEYLEFLDTEAEPDKGV